VSENEELHQELEELRREGEENAQDDLEKQNEGVAEDDLVPANPLNLNVAGNDNPSPIPPQEVEHPQEVEDAHHNEVEYTNGQASMRELFSRIQAQALLPEIPARLLNEPEPDI
jgi:hypothetical protein